MSVKEKVKVFWKTSDEWRDCPHWPKRKDIKASGDTDTLVPLKQGDTVKIKFGARWYDAEVVEAWQARRTKNGKFCVHVLILSFYACQCHFLFMYMACKLTLQQINLNSFNS